MLQESEIHFEVLQEYASGARVERISLGNVRLNLAEYVEGDNNSTEGGGEEGGITRRYLMQDSRINSTLKVRIGGFFSGRGMILFGRESNVSQADFVCF